MTGWMMMRHSDMDFYQTQTRATAMYPEVGTGSQIALAYCGLGLGEAGEVQGKIKKIIRDDNGHMSPERRDAIIGELGDVLWYVARLADEMRVPLSEVGDRNLSKLRSRKERNVLTGSGDMR